VTEPVELVRRRPTQQRAAETVEHVLHAASRLLARVSPEELTTTQIAAEAGISVGGLYRFYADKQAILDQLAVRHVRAFEEQLGPLFARVDLFDGPALLSGVIDLFVEYLEANPDFRALALGRHVSASAREQETSPDFGPTGLLKRTFIQRLGLQPDAELDLRLRVVSETGERLIAFAYAQRSESEKQAVLAETKRMLSMYMFGPVPPGS
jgi:AcrR family transcriptional regulator